MRNQKSPWQGALSDATTPLDSRRDTPSGPTSKVCFPAPGPGYVARYMDGETWDVVGFDRAGHPLINVAGEIVPADSFPLYETQGFRDLLGVRS